MKKLFQSLSFIGLGVSSITFAATPVNVHTHPEVLPVSNMHVANSLSLNNSINLEQISKDQDANHITHVRMQQTYAGIPVFGAVSILHQSNQAHALIANSKPSADGLIYNGLQQDLARIPAPKLDNALTKKALDVAKEKFSKLNPKKYPGYQDESVKVIIYVDKKNQAHYGLLTSFYVDDHKSGAHRPVMIINAETMKVVRHGDVVKYENEKVIPVVGMGGNEKTGQITYDGLNGHSQPTSMRFMPSKFAESDGVCVFANDRVEVQDVAYENAIPTAECAQNVENNLYYLIYGEADEKGFFHWEQDEVNSSYSPSYDALYAANTVIKLFDEWYGIPVLVKDDHKTPMILEMHVHYGRNFDNAFWNGKVMIFGDGDDEMYSLTSLDVSAHEVAHGFTQQNSNIDPLTDDEDSDEMPEDSFYQMGALDESFSDMASAAAIYYTTGKNDWKCGTGIMKNTDAMRYMDDPKKDGSSINNYNDPHPDEPHALAGVFNRAFYLIATSPGWNTHKAFDVMVEANRHYWTPSMKNLNDAACGVMAATKGLKYSEVDVKAALENVGFDVSKCG